MTSIYRMSIIANRAINVNREGKWQTSPFGTPASLKETRERFSGGALAFSGIEANRERYP